MPTNLPPEYFEVERRYKAATSPRDQIRLLEELISTVPKHKGTDKLRANMRRRLSKLKSRSESKKSGGRQESAYQIGREGAGQVVVIGATNSGKSALVTALTNATPEVSAGPFTTWTPTPGMMTIDNVQVQLIDTPPLDRDYVEPDLLDLIRRADLVLITVDLHTNPVEQLEGITALLEEHRIIPEHRQELYTGVRRPTVVPVLVLANKCDDESLDELCDIFCELLDEEWPHLAISAVTGRRLEALKQAVFDQLEIMRIYSRAPGREPDLDSPFVMPAGSTVEEFAREIHLDFYRGLKSARVWGSSAFDGQMVPRDYVLHDGDIVELRI